MQKPESRPKFKDGEEKGVTKKPYSAPTLVELGADLTEKGGPAGDLVSSDVSGAPA